MNKTATDSDTSNIAQTIATSLGLSTTAVNVAIRLFKDGNTIPFIARYRKEATGGLDEIALRKIEDALERIQALSARKKTVLKSIAEQDRLTAELKTQIENCTDLKTLEAIYLPYKPSRRTRASVARERGLQPLADLLIRQEKLTQSKEATLQKYVDPTKEVPDPQTALTGALDIVAEQWAENPETREWLIEQANSYGKIASKVKRGKKESGQKFEAYFDRQEPVRKIPSHRFLAIMRGVSEGFLNVSLVLEGNRELSELKRRLLHNRHFEFNRELQGCVEDCLDRILMRATESSVLQTLKEQADGQAIEVFGKNLQDLLMASPAGPHVTIGIDPGFRTGCKVAVVDGTGKFLDNTTIFPTAPKNDTSGAAATLLKLIKKHSVELIAIGNGTASRETESFVADLIKVNQLDITKVVVSESGASIYSASEVAVEEFPDLDITVRGAISIARRLQDPLAELVKTDPKSIGVGQYQHEVNQKQLKKCLDRVVQSCVNLVGVDVNMASVSLLSYVAGIGPKLAGNIVNFRETHGRFTSRKDLNSVPKLGKKAFEQAAGFLRIRGGQQPLDNSAVHPESYSVVTKMAKSLKTKTEKLVGNAALSQTIIAADFVEGSIGLPTVQDIISELAKPGRDPRSEFQAVRFDDKISSIEDLREGLVLEGVISNVTHFGAFTDIGVHQDGLIHISQLSNDFVSDPCEVVSVGDVVKVKVLEVDVARKRISLTRKF